MVEIYNYSSIAITKGATDNGYIGKYALIIHNSSTEKSIVSYDNGYIFAYYQDQAYLLGYRGFEDELVLPNSSSIDNITFNYYIVRECSFTNMSITSVVLSSSITKFESLTFFYCQNLETIVYDGTISEWNTIKPYLLCSNTKATKVICSDGEVNL